MILIVDTEKIKQTSANIVLVKTLIAEGLSRQKVAKELGITTRTVDRLKKKVNNE